MVPPLIRRLFQQIITVIRPPVTANIAMPASEASPVSGASELVVEGVELVELVELVESVVSGPNSSE